MTSTRINGTVAALALVAALIALLSLASSAGAATISNDGGVLRWTGTDQNDEVRFEYEAGKVTVLSQTGQPQTPGNGCTPSDDGSAGVAYCEAAPGTRIVLDFKGGNDRLGSPFRDAPIVFEANGGPGNDELDGGQLGDILVGGPGMDSLRGGAGDDVLDLQDGGEEGAGTTDCGEGNDTLKVDANGVDVEGGAQSCETVVKATPLGGTAQGGFDDTRVQYKAQPGVKNDVTVQKVGKDLRISDPAGVNAGQGCERERPEDPTTVLCKFAGEDSYQTDFELGDGDDTLKVIEAPHGASPTYDGGPGNDRIEGAGEGSTIKGGDGDDVLIGNAGIDTLDGGAGDDSLNGGTGFDKFSGGAGSDQIDTRDGSYKTGRNDVIGEQGSCGAGRDTLTADISDVPAGCEKLVKKDTSPAAQGTLQLVGGSTYKMGPKNNPSLSIKVKCVGGPCEGRAYIFGSGSYAFPFNATKDGYKLQAGQTLTRKMYFGSGYGAFREALGKKGRVKMFLATVTGDEQGHTSTARKAITVTAKKGLR